MNKKLLTVVALAGLFPIITSAAQEPDVAAPQTWEYCTSGVNSTGNIGVTHIQGNLRISDNETWLMSYNCPPETWGVFLMGATPTRLLFGDGYLCISPFDTPIYRMGQPEMSNFIGISMKHLDFNAYPLPGMCWESGSTWYFQCYFRDQAAGGTGFNLSNGLGARFVL